MGSQDKLVARSTYSGILHSREFNSESLDNLGTFQVLFGSDAQLVFTITTYIVLQAPICESIYYEAVRLGFRSCRIVDGPAHLRLLGPACHHESKMCHLEADSLCCQDSI